jgi:hypothetical protein
MNPLHRTPPRPLDFLSVRGHSHIVITGSEWSRSHGAIGNMAPGLLDAWDALLDSRDAAHELPDGRLPA